MPLLLEQVGLEVDAAGDGGGGGHDHVVRHVVRRLRAAEDPAAVDAVKHQEQFHRFV